MRHKLKSRKFWICIAAFLGSVATSISGIASESKAVTITGTICGILSAAIYSFAEAWIDSKGFHEDYDDIYPDDYLDD